MDILSIAHAFRLEGEAVSAQPFGNGHINSTYCVTTDCGAQYVLQKINTDIFKDPEGLMANAVGVTEHIRSRGGKAMTFVPTHGGSYCYADGWRVSLLEKGLCLETAEKAEDFYQSGLAFGRFQQALADYPAHTLHETIPGFHNTPLRFAQLKAAVEENRSGRLAQCRQEVDYALSLESLASRLQQMLEDGRLPLRVTHNDTKLNNVLLDPETHGPLCVLDLDTVMPGLVAYDFGDAIRFGAATAAEDEPDASKMKLDLELFEAFARGFLEGAAALTEAEVQTLPLAAFTMTLECGIRFLADFLNGDTYFRTHYPEHNLVRTRTQLALCADMLARWEEMTAVIEKIGG